MGMARAKKRATQRKMRQLPLGLERQDRAEQRKMLGRAKRGRPRKNGAKIDHRPCDRSSNVIRFCTSH